jgi:hypothetical protein
MRQTDRQIDRQTEPISEDNLSPNGKGEARAEKMLEKKGACSTSLHMGLLVLGSCREARKWKIDINICHETSRFKLFCFSLSLSGYFSIHSQLRVFQSPVGWKK